MGEPASAVESRPAPTRLLIASSNAGKLREYREMASGWALEINLLPNFREVPAFGETAPTFAENSLGKALHYGRFTDELVMAEDSGLVVPALGGAPGVFSARYAGPDGTDTDCIRKLLRAMEGRRGSERRARFVCVTTLVQRGHALAIVSDLMEGAIAEAPRGAGGFGYDPVFLLPDIGQTSAEISQHEKSLRSHRGKAFCKIQNFLIRPTALTLS